MDDGRLFLLNGREKTPVYEDADGYQVMSLVLMNEAKTLGAKQLLIYGRTVAQDGCGSTPEEFKAAAEDLKSKSKVAVKLKRKFTLKVPYDLSQSRGSGVFEISSVGFDSSRTHAAVTVFQACGALCGGGSTYLFRRVTGNWQKVAQICELAS